MFIADFKIGMDYAIDICKEKQGKASLTEIEVEKEVRNGWHPS